MAESLQPVLIIYSHGRNPPLHPPPDLKYDLRSIPNPPKALRAVSDGRSKRLREHLLSEPRFVDRLASVEQGILAAMDVKIKDYGEQVRQEAANSRVMKEERKLEEQPETRNNQTGPLPDEVEVAAVEDEGEGEEEDVSDISTNEHEILLRVGCNCALGHHRSVAFVQELAQRPWPRDWQIHIVHRDLEKKRAGGARKAQKANFRETRQESMMNED